MGSNRKQAVLRVPWPLSEDDFDHLNEMFTEFFGKQKRMITASREENGSANQDQD